ncbi:DNA adenine methylase [Bradyrhizobium oligotrophicum]|uniref:DNA adenine methylase n=1 Tax=Bradyrhizobium oligotrophicum TaxID=44255 RepID=UPI003EB9BCA6
MKYMGSKRAMLRNGLGDLLDRELQSSRRFVDLFSGSAAVANHVAQRSPVPVLAADLQEFSVALAAAVITRQEKLDWQPIWSSWFKRAEAEVIVAAPIRMTSSSLTERAVQKQRAWSNECTTLPITKAYGGHYFSAEQAVWIDALRGTLPTARDARRVALAALIRSASHCAASPGHTAQPFQPTPTGIKYLAEAWRRDLVEQTKKNFIFLAETISLSRGEAKRGDANLLAKSLREGDLVFIDPPYSGVHYSRFYHVLESVARGSCGDVEGRGRYPSAKRRPRSSYSVQTEAMTALDDLLGTIAARGSKVVLTFPAHPCSNGLSGALVQEIAAKHFRVTYKSVASRFSTMGGTSDNRGNQAGRSARKDAEELILRLDVRRA